MTIGTIDRLFLKFTTRYGSRWTAQLDDEALLKLTKAEWYEELKTLTVGDIKTGLNSWDGRFPPNIIEFKKVCRPAPCYKIYHEKALPAPKNKQRGNNCLKKIRDYL